MIVVVAVAAAVSDGVAVVVGFVVVVSVFCILILEHLGKIL